MTVSKRQRREKPTKIEQKKVCGPQVKQTTLLAGPIYIGQAQGETLREEPRWQRSRTGRTLSPPQIHQKSI